MNKLNYPKDYLLEKVSILGLNFSLDEKVLIPRYETEVWLNSVLKLFKPELFKQLNFVCENLNLPLVWQEIIKPEETNLLDVGCGSGFIGLVLQKYLQFQKTLLIDISFLALEKAKLNAKLNNIDVSFLESDLLEKIAPIDLKNSLLIANLPYLPTSDYKDRFQNRVNFEPKIALYSGTDGLYTFRKLIKQLKKQTYIPKMVMLELDPRNIQKAKKILAKLYLQTQIFTCTMGNERFLAGW